MKDHFGCDYHATCEQCETEPAIVLSLVGFLCQACYDQLKANIGLTALAK